MQNSNVNKNEISIATIDDVTFIKSWLKREYEKNFEGFYSNLNLIQEGQRNGELFVSRKANDAVAFQLGKLNADIVSVREENRREGHASDLFIALLERAKMAGNSFLVVQCVPEESLTFWKKLGFKCWHPANRSGVWAYYLVEKINNLTHPERIINLKIEFHSDSAIYENSSNLVQTYLVKGEITARGIILERRIFGIQEKTMFGMAIRIKAANRELLFCKAIDLEASSPGVILYNNNLVSIDSIILNEADGRLMELVRANH